MLDKTKRYLVVGLGLLGGKYALELSKAGFHVDGINRSEGHLQFALDHGYIERGKTHDFEDLVREADHIIFGLYPTALIEWFRTYGPLLKPGCIFTDVSGVKTGLVEPVQALCPAGVEFIASHPMAGRETSSVEHAAEVNFAPANFIITPTGKNTPEAIAWVRELAEVLGFKHICTLTVQEHDRMVGYVSQLCHAIAVSLMCANDNTSLCEYTGDSFRDLTRIARINDKMWAELFLWNRDNLISEIDQFDAALGALRSALAAGYVAGLQDPYARYYSTDAYKQALLLREGCAAGVGIRLKTDAQSRLVVDKLDADAAAEKAGVQVGDIVTQVNGNAVAGPQQASLQEMLDTSTEKLAVSVLRGDKAIAFELTAYTYNLKSVQEKMLNETVGYIRITAFYDNTLNQFKAACSSLENQGAASYIFDVRGCSGGGSTDTLKAMLSYLLPHGAYAAWVDGRTENLVADDARTLSGTFAVVTDEKTKGEAELFAGVLQEFGVATVVGEKTAGKGKIQDFVALKADNSAIYLTVGEIVLMRGGSIEGVGITPTVAVSLPAAQKAQGAALKTEDDAQVQAALNTFKASTNQLNSTAATTAAARTAATTAAAEE